MRCPQILACLFAPVNNKHCKYDLLLTWLIHFKRCKAKLTVQSQLRELQGRPGTRQLIKPLQPVRKTCFNSEHFTKLFSWCLRWWCGNRNACPGLTENKSDGEGRGGWLPSSAWDRPQVNMAPQALFTERIRFPRPAFSTVPTAIWHLCFCSVPPPPLPRPHHLSTYSSYSHPL